MEALLVRLEAQESAAARFEAQINAALDAQDLGVEAPMPAADPAAIGTLPLLMMAPLAVADARPYRSAYQVWIEVASRVLRDVDVGAIVRRRHPERIRRYVDIEDRPWLTEEQLQRQQDADLVQEQRKRMAFSGEESRDLVRLFWSVCAQNELSD